MGKCQLIENAIKDPNWNPEMNEKLCIGDCDICHHFIRTEIPEIIKQKYKDAIPGKLEFIKYILDTSLEKTNKELSQRCLDNFQYYSHNKDTNSGIFQFACNLFNLNLLEILDNIRKDIYQGVIE